MTINYPSIIQTQTLTVDGVDFDATLWFDESDMTVDIEASGLVFSKYLGKGSTPIEVEANVYTVPIAEWDNHFEAVARSAMTDV